MADNFQTGSGTGGPNFAAASITFSGDTVFAVGGFGVILSGSADSYTGNLIVGGAGAVGAGVQRITLASDDPAVTDLAAIEVLLTSMDSDTDAIKTAVQLIDNAISGAGFNVTQFAGVGISMGTGARDAGTQRVTLATNDSLAVTNAGTFAVQAVCTNAGTFAVQAVCTNAGTFAVQATLAAETSKVIGTVNIAAAQTLATVTTVGAVTAISNALPAGTNLLGKVSIDQATANANEVVTKTGSVTAATQSGTWNITNVSGTISLPTGAATEATLSTLNGKVTACNTGAVVVASGSITANAGTNLNTSALALESGGNLAAAATSLGVIDDWDDGSDRCRVVGAAAEDAAAAGNPVLVGGRYDATARTLEDGDAGAVALTPEGHPFVAAETSNYTYDGNTRCEVKRFRVKCGNGANTLISAVASKKVRLRSLAFLATSATAVTAYLSTTTDTGVLGDSTDKLTFDLDGGGGPAGVVLPYNPDGWLQTSTVNEALTCTLSAAEEVWVIGTYIEVA